MSLHPLSLYQSNPNDEENEPENQQLYPYNPCQLNYNEPFTLIFNRVYRTYTNKEVLLIKGINIVDVKVSNSFCVLLDQFGKVYVRIPDPDDDSTTKLDKFLYDDENNEKENEIKLLKFTKDEPIEKIFAKFSSIFILLSKKGNVYLFGARNDSKYNKYLDENKKLKDEYLKGERIIEASCGDSHILLLSESGKLFGFGDNNYGQLGVKEISDYGEVVFKESQIDHIYSKIVKVYTTYNTSFVLTENGELYGCGSTDYAASGMPLDCQNERNTLTRVPIKDKVVEVYNGYFFVAVRTINSKFYVFGYNNFNQFGESTTYGNAHIYGPHPFNFNNNDIEEMECGGYGSIIVTKSRQVYYSGEFNQAFMERKNNFTEIDLRTHLGNHQVFSNQNCKLNVRAASAFVVFFATTTKTIADIFNLKNTWKISDITCICN
ncbi:hypothetical protein ABK040_002923 [Willaertia magna]